jgi:hypothetical protein
MSRVRKQDEPDSEWSKDKCQWDEEGRMGQVINIQLGYVGGAYNYTPSKRWGFMGMDDTWRPIELREAYQKYMEGKTFEYLCENVWVPGGDTLELRPQLDRTHEEVPDPKPKGEKADPEDDSKVKFELSGRAVEQCEKATGLKQDVARVLEQMGVVDQEFGYEIKSGHDVEQGQCASVHIEVF